jgi:hypothetical protein
MSLAVPTGFRVFRPQPTPFTLGAGSEAMGTGTLGQSFVDFDALGAHFWVVMGGAVQSVFGGSGRLRLRVGGTYGAVDGDLAVDASPSAGSFAVFSVIQAVTNIWSGVQLVKVTGWNWNASFSFACLDFIPK